MREIITRLQYLVDKHGSGNLTVFTERTGIPYSTFHGYMKGRMPHSEHLLRIRDKLGVSIDWILTGQGKENVTDILEEKKVHSDCFQEVAELQEWLAEISEKDPDRRVWFKMELKDHFPLFKEWLKKRHQANPEVGKQQAA